MRRTDSLEKTLILKNTEGRRRNVQERRRWFDGLIDLMDQLNGQEFEQALRVVDRRGSLACCSPWGLKELDMTEQLNSTEDLYTEEIKGYCILMKSKGV